MSQTRRLQFLAGLSSSLWRHRSTEKFQSRPKMAYTTSQREIPRRIYVICVFVLKRWAKLAEHCAMEPDYFRSFKQSRRLSIFVVHEIQLRPRCIMESVYGSLNTELCETSIIWRQQTYQMSSSACRGRNFSRRVSIALYWCTFSTNRFVIVLRCI